MFIKTGIVYLRIKGGIGNQLFEYAFAKSLSIDLNFKLIIDSQTGFTRDTYKRICKARYFIKKYNEANILDKSLFFFTKKFPNFTKKFLLSYLVLEKNHKQIELLNITNLKKYKYIYIEGYFQSYHYFEKNWNYIFETIKFKFNYNENIVNWQTDIRKNTSISIHVRRINYEPKLEVNYYKEAIEYFLVKSSLFKFYIFSDDIEWCKKEFNFLENKVFISNLDGDEVAELFLMTKCNHNIIANSSYSWWGAYLSNKISEKIVIAPVNTQIGVNGMFYPSQWTLI